MTAGGTAAGGTVTGAPAPALVAIAHGSRDPRSAATIDALAREVSRRRPDLDVRVSFLDLSAPRLPDVLAAVAADGHRDAVVVPLLLGSAFHARVDVPTAVAEAGRALPRLRIATADVLGPSPGLDAAALSRLRTALGTEPRDPGPGDPGLNDLGLNDPGLNDPGLGVVLASVGSSRADANRAVADRVAGWRRRFGWAAASAAYVTAAEPTPDRAIELVRAAGARRVAVVPWVLAPGRLPDRIEAAAAAGDAVVAEPLGPHPFVADVVLRRWAEAVSRDTTVRRVG